MRFDERIQSYDRLHNLIKRQSTGTPAELAVRLGVSERTIYNMILMLENYGASVKYLRYKKSFAYEKYVSFSFNPVRE
jgi:transcriptional antiterminator